MFLTVSFIVLQIFITKIKLSFPVWSFHFVHYPAALMPGTVALWIHSKTLFYEVQFLLANLCQDITSPGHQKHSASVSDMISTSNLNRPIYRKINFKQLKLKIIRITLTCIYILILTMKIETKRINKA